MLLCLFLIVSCQPPASLQNRDIVYHITPFKGLMAGFYDGMISVGDLKTHGDTGLGGFDRLDGELVALDGDIYQVRVDGMVRLMNDSATSCFAVMTFFEEDLQKAIESPASMADLMRITETSMPSENFVYAILIRGEFEWVLTRSIPAQTKPYPPLTDVVNKQTTFRYENVEGTIVGFWVPSYMAGVNKSGHHWHFLTKDRKGGGHLLDCRMIRGMASLDESNTYMLVIPDHPDFRKMDLSQNDISAVKRVIGR